MNSSKLRSMTAYGRSSHHSHLGRFVVEVQSLNRKFLEINLFLPKEFVRYDIEIRKWIAEKITRGLINISISYRPDVSQSLHLTPNLPLAKSLHHSWKTIINELNLHVNDDVLVKILAHEKEIIFNEDTVQVEDFQIVLKELINNALEQLLFMKEKEGHALHLDILKRLENLQKFIDDIAQKTTLAPKKYYDKLKQRVEEYFLQSHENEERVLREIAVFSEKVDVSEEITRFNSHLKQFHHFLYNPPESPGKTLDFLIQELNREINTIGSKSSDATIAHLVVSVKSELEKIREQVQNIE